MLLLFSVSNFRSFHGLQTLNLSANPDKSLPQNCINPDLPGLKNQRWVKGVGIYGANASGKSTLIDALKALSQFVKNSAQRKDPKDEIEEIEPFALDPNSQNIPTAFGIVFVSEKIRYEYRVAATRQQIFHESLRAFPKGSEQIWFSRDWCHKRESYEFSPKNPVGLPRDRNLEQSTLTNVLYLSKRISENRKDVEPAFRWLVNGLKFLDLSSRENGGGIGDGFTKTLLQHSNNNTREHILKLLRHADIGVTDAEVAERSLTKNELKLIEGVDEQLRTQLISQWGKEVRLTHDAGELPNIQLPWETESAGTHRFFALIGPWLDILAQGYTVCIDELETSLHPIMMRELLKLIFHDNENYHRAQIIFTTHNPLLLDTTLIRRDQIWFTDKDNQGNSHLYPITDYKPRKGESLVRGYMAGRYGAVPFIPRGLLGDKNTSADLAAKNTSNEST